MLPVKKIMCPTDFSEPSFLALKVAVELSMQFASTLYVVHVVPPIPPLAPTMPGIPYTVAESTGIGDKYREELMKASKEALEQVVAGQTLKNLEIKPIILEGNIAELIVETAKVEGIDMVVMGTHGLTGWRHLLFGSVAAKVVRISQCPVLTVPDPHENTE